MLEAVRDQAAGLLAWKLQPPTRVLAVAAAERGAASLELLWRLREGCRALELPCVVMEGPPERWGDGLEPGGVGLWHAPVSALWRDWRDVPGRPLVALTADPAALVDAYRAIKALSGGGLHPVVVALPDEGDETMAPHGALQAALAALRRTCQQHLRAVPPVWTLGYHAQRSADPAGEGTLLRVLEAAWTLEAPCAMGGRLRPC